MSINSRDLSYNDINSIKTYPRARQLRVSEQWAIILVCNFSPVSSLHTFDSNYNDWQVKLKRKVKSAEGCLFGEIIFVTVGTVGTVGTAQ